MNQTLVLFFDFFQSNPINYRKVRLFSFNDFIVWLGICSFMCCIPFPFNRSSISFVCYDFINSMTTNLILNFYPSFVPKEDGFENLFYTTFEDFWNLFYTTFEDFCGHKKSITTN